MKIKEIIIKNNYKQHRPRPEKLKHKEQYLKKYHKYMDPIIINQKNELIDGYITYILAHFHNEIPTVLKRIGPREYYIEINF